MIKRGMLPVVRRQLRDHPAVALTGPRQAGKTTLARALSPLYFDLEQESDRLRLDVRWEQLRQARQLVILDEAQAWPEIFPRLRGAIDGERGRNGRFLLLGSVSPALMHHVSESLAGRLALAELTPLLAAELPRARLDQLWRCGGYPDGGVLNANAFPDWQKNYLSLLAQRDLPNWGLPSRAPLTQRLLKMLALLHGQQWNASQTGQSLGLSHPTVNSYLDYLVGAFLIRSLPPYASNLRKRLVRSPKVYWRDSGLLHALHGVTAAVDLLSQPWVGASWEGFVIEQILGQMSLRGCAVEAYYLRTSDQYEIDLVLDFGHRLWAVEIKLTSRPAPADLHRLNKTADLIKADRRFLITRAREAVNDGRQTVCSLPWFLQHVET